MVPPPEAYDWSNVYGIAFKFQSDNNPQEVLSLNGSYAETVPLTAPEISTLFTSDANDEGPRTLGPAPVTALREAFCNSITLDMANIDELAKGHIAQLLAACPVRFFDSAGREAVRGAEATNDPEPLATVLFNINQWKFKRNWKTNDPANYFNGIYTYTNGIPTDTNCTCAVVPTPHSSSPSVPPNTAILTVPIKPVKSEAHTAIQVPSSCATSSLATTDLPTIKLIDSDVMATPSNTTTSVPSATANLGPLQPVGPIADTPSANAPLNRSHSTASTPSPSDNILQVLLTDDEPSPVTTPPVSPSARTRFGHHSAPPCEPANFRWTFNPQSETVVFHCLPKPASVPLKPSLQLPLPKAIHKGILTFAEHSAYSSHLPCEISFSSNQRVFCITKRHRDALKIKIYQGDTAYFDDLDRGQMNNNNNNTAANPPSELQDRSMPPIEVLSPLRLSGTYKPQKEGTNSSRYQGDTAYFGDLDQGQINSSNNNNTPKKEGTDSSRYQGDTAYFGDLDRGQQTTNNNNTVANPPSELKDQSMLPIEVYGLLQLFDTY
eukprot:jgi/Psemu1/19882/gm1.19882_g